MVDEVVPPEAQEQPWLFPWETGKPLHFASGFTINGGNVTVRLTYLIYAEGVLLFSTVQIGAQPVQTWRRYWTSHVGAVESAENMCADAHEYITKTWGMRPRGEEDLDLDDFIEHLSARLNNELH